jgi:hypothetical protein
MKPHFASKGRYSSRKVPINSSKSAAAVENRMLRGVLERLDVFA